jgi:hypothetical protein
MCTTLEWIAIAGLALSTVSAGASYMGQQEQANQASKSQQAQAKYRLEVAEQATQNYLRQSNNLAIRAGQEREAAGQRAFNTRVEALKESAANRVSAGEAGVTGISVDSLLADFYGREGRAQQATSANLNNALLSINDQQQSAYAEVLGAVNYARQPMRPVNYPSLFGPALEIAGAGITFADRLDEANSPDRKDKA